MEYTEKSAMHTFETSNRLLVTFAVFAYNQEQYIREAVEGAFAQTYEPLEIILSDDCSTDRTFEIIQEMAAAYEGPHTVRVRRNPKNIGTVDHLITVAREAAGKILVVAAGDDISYAERAESIADAWLPNSNTLAAFSLADAISAEGHIIRRNLNSTYKPSFQSIMADCKAPKQYPGGYRNIPGYSAAYQTEVVRELPLSNSRVLNEDSLMSYYINCLGGNIIFIESSLLSYRSDFISSERRAPYAERHANIMKQEKKNAAFAKSTANYYSYLFELLRKSSVHDAETVIARLEARRQLAIVQRNFLDYNIIKRLSILLNASSVEIARYGIPRLFGLNVFAHIKCLVKQS